MRIRLSRLYDGLVLLILYYCSLQEVIIPLIYKLSGSATIANIFFYFKDLLLFLLFFAAIISKRVRKPLLLTSLLLLACDVVILLNTAFNTKETIPILTLLGATRSLIILPMLCCIGGAINDLGYFKSSIVKRWFPFIVFMAFAGIIEFYLDRIVSTKSFWINTMGYTDYYTTIKHQTSRTMVMGLPGNFYKSGKNGYFTSKRLVGFWGSPLTAAYNMLPALIYYFLEAIPSCQKGVFSKSDTKCMGRFIILLIALYLTTTRIIILCFILVVVIYIFKNIKRNVLLLLVVLFVGISGIIVTDFSQLRSYFYDGSTRGHILSLTTSLRVLTLSLFGEGIGKYGTYGIGTESTYISILGSTGVIGLALSMILLFMSIKVSQKYKNDTIAIVVTYAGIAYLITGVVSEQMLAFTSIVQFYVFLGYCHQLKNLDNLTQEYLRGA